MTILPPPPPKYKTYDTDEFLFACLVNQESNDEAIITFPTEFLGFERFGTGWGVAYDRYKINRLRENYP